MNFCRTVQKRQSMCQERRTSRGGPLDDIASIRIESERTQADLIGCVASIVDALACLTFLLLPATPATRARLCILLLVDPIMCIIGYCLLYRRLCDIRPK